MVIAGERVREARERRGWGAPILAHHMGVTPQTVYRWEWGETQPSARKAQELALVLGVTLASLASND